MRKAFTLIELMVVMIIIGVLAGIGIKYIPTAINNANAQSLAAQLQEVKTALGAYYADTGTYPCDIKYLWSSPAADANAKCYDSLSLMAEAEEDIDVKNHWSGPYLANAQTTGKVLKANFGNGISIGAASISDADGSVVPLKNGEGVPAPATSFANVLVITGLEPSHILAAYKAINGNSIDSNKAALLADAALKAKVKKDAFTDARLVASDQVSYEAGVSAFTGGKTVYMIYRFTNDFSGRAN